MHRYMHTVHRSAQSPPLLPPVFPRLICIKVAGSQATIPPECNRCVGLVHILHSDPSHTVVSQNKLDRTNRYVSNRVQAYAMPCISYTRIELNQSSSAKTNPVHRVSYSGFTPRATNHVTSSPCGSCGSLCVAASCSSNSTRPAPSNAARRRSSVMPWRLGTSPWWDSGKSWQPRPQP